MLNKTLLPVLLIATMLVSAFTSADSLLAKRDKEGKLSNVFSSIISMRDIQGLRRRNLKKKKSPKSPKKTKSPKSIKGSKKPKGPKSTKKTKVPKSPKKKKKGKSSKKTKTVFVSPGESIQQALDNASDGDTIFVKAGTYVEESNPKYGLRITNHNIKLYAAYDDDQSLTDPGVRIIASGAQETGLYVAPEGCEYKDRICNNDNIEGFFLRGISVEEFPKNGIQTRWVNDFEITNCKSINNLNNGIYLTLSSNGRVENCISLGSLDSGLWVAGSVGIQVIHSELSDSVTGFEVTVSKDVFATNNIIHGNVVGVGFYHANMAGTDPDYPSFDNWVFENNKIVDNNRVNTAPAGSFQASLPSGIGVLLVGVRGHTFRQNTIEDNAFQGILMTGLCSVLELSFGSSCVIEPPSDGDPSSNYNTIIENMMGGNGVEQNPDLPFLPPSDILYGQTIFELGEAGEQNCFEGNKSIEDGGPVVGVAVDFATFLPYPLPTDGCN